MKLTTSSQAATFVVALANVLVVLSEDVTSKNAMKKKGDFAEENYGVRYASKCEVCKIVTSEVEHQLNSKFKSAEAIETGYNYMQVGNKKKTAYETSLIRLQEALESTCAALLEYNIHKERKDWTRFARGQSQTFSTLHGLRNKGVKVDLGIPEEMWDKPSAEISQLKSQCDTFLENNEESIEEWYQERGDAPLEEIICKSVLPKKEQGCLGTPSKSTLLKGDAGKKPKKSEL